jgi:ribosome modulation factor
MKERFHGNKKGLKMEAYKQGYLAFLNGATEDKNPYITGSHNNESCAYGWSAAQFLTQ